MIIWNFISLDLAETISAVIVFSSSHFVTIKNYIIACKTYLNRILNLLNIEDLRS
jgi:hypothetical protein